MYSKIKQQQYNNFFYEEVTKLPIKQLQSNTNTSAKNKRKNKRQKQAQE